MTPPPAERCPVCEHDTQNGYCRKCGVLLLDGVVQTYSAEEIAQAKDYAKRVRELFSEPKSAEPELTLAEKAKLILNRAATSAILERAEPAAEVSAPREWTLLGIVHQGPELTTCAYLQGGPPVSVHERIHVIEKSAFEAVCAERDALLAIHDEYKHGEAARVIAALKAENAVLAESVRQDYDPTARDAAIIEKLKAERDELAMGVHRLNDDLKISWAETKTMVTERDQLRRELSSREAAHTQTLEQASGYIVQIARLTKERDEARAEVERLGKEVEELMRVDYWQDRHDIVVKENKSLKNAIKYAIEKSYPIVAAEITRLAEEGK